MSWLDDLKDASFRGAPFYVAGAEETFGRRTVLTEYPGRDLPDTEDLGRRARQHRIEAYVLGPDYMAARDELRTAIEQPGAGELIHPFLGKKRVVVHGEVRSSESTQQGGIAQLSFTCVEVGEQEAAAPTVSPATQAAVEVAADAAVAAVSAEAEDELSIAGEIDGVYTAAVGHISDALATVRQIEGKTAAALATADSLAADLAELADTAEKLAAAPALLAATIANVCHDVLARIADIPAALASVIAQYGAATLAWSGGPETYRTRAEQLSSAVSVLTDFGVDFATVPTDTPQGETQATNQVQLVRLLRGVGLAEASRVAAQLEYESSDQAVALRDQLAEGLDAVAEEAADETYAALLRLRAAVAKHLSSAAAQLPSLADYTPQESLPALVLAHQIHGDATRDAELIARNNISNPCFVPGGETLKVLSDG
jgi:prophage DNA circulation protein